VQNAGEASAGVLPIGGEAPSSPTKERASLGGLAHLRWWRSMHLGQACRPLVPKEQRREEYRGANEQRDGGGQLKE
jgi:hypothetical protein